MTWSQSPGFLSLGFLAWNVGRTTVPTSGGVAKLTEVLPSSSGQDTSHIGLGPTLMTASYFNHFFEVPFSKYSHIPRAPGIRRSTCELEGGAAQASQPIPGEMMKILYLGTALEREYKVKGTNCTRPHEARAVVAPWCSAAVCTLPASWGTARADPAESSDGDSGGGQGRAGCARSWPSAPNTRS